VSNPSRRPVSHDDVEACGFIAPLDADFCVHFPTDGSKAADHVGKAHKALGGVGA